MLSQWLIPSIFYYQVASYKLHTPNYSFYSTDGSSGPKGEEKLSKF